jgi:hypothetical protein
MDVVPVSQIEINQQSLKGSHALVDKVNCLWKKCVILAKNME